MSTVVAMKKAMVSALTAQPALAGVQITYSEDVHSPRKERIYCGDVEEHDAEPATMRYGRVRSEENYTFRLFVSVVKKGTEAAEMRVLELLGAVEELLATDPKLSTAEVPPRISFATFAGYRLASNAAGQETVATIEADIRVKARNT